MGHLSSVAVESHGIEVAQSALPLRRVDRPVAVATHPPLWAYLQRIFCAVRTSTVAETWRQVSAEIGRLRPPVPLESLKDIPR